MEEKRVFLKMIKVLEELKIPYMITGAVASILYGEPRLTDDIDVVIALRRTDVPLLRKNFPEDEFYTPTDETIFEEMNRRGQFNIIHVPTAIKMDCIILKDSDFELEQFKRRRRIPFVDTAEASISSPESVILSKMLFYKEGKSEKHITDIIGMLRISGDIINRDYVKRWAQELGISEIWNMILEKVKEDDK